MPVATIFSKQLLKTVRSARCLSWYSNHLLSTNKQSADHVHLCLRKKLPVVASNSIIQCRFKYDKFSSKKNRVEEVDDEERDAFEEFDDKGNKTTTVRVSSLRMDLVIKSALGLARNKVESAFYDSRIRVNGQKILKKSVTLHVGDEVDVIKGISPLNNEHLIVSRLEIIGAKGNEEDISVALRKFKNLTIENYNGQNVFKASSD